MSFEILTTPSNPPLALVSKSQPGQGDRVVGNVVMMLGTQRAILVPFLFEIIFAVPAQGGSCWVIKYWAFVIGIRPYGVDLLL